jgi:hypothetical protein
MSFFSKWHKVISQVPSGAKSRSDVVVISDPRIIAGACAIVDIWFGGDRSWRRRLEESEFLESADWATAVEHATAVIRSLEAS